MEKEQWCIVSADRGCHDTILAIGTFEQCSARCTHENTLYQHPILGGIDVHVVKYQGVETKNPKDEYYEPFFDRDYVIEYVKELGLSPYTGDPDSILLHASTDTRLKNWKHGWKLAVGNHLKRQGEDHMRSKFTIRHVMLIEE